MTSYRVVSYDNGYGQGEGSGLSLESAELVAASVAGRAFGGRDEAKKYRAKDTPLPCWRGHGLKVEVVEEERERTASFGLDGEAQRREAAQREADVQRRRAPHHGGAPEDAASSATVKDSSLHADMVAAGVPTDSRESDLYVKDTPEARAILARHQTHATNARRFRHTETGELWIDIPFAFEPFWQKKPR